MRPDSWCATPGCGRRRPDAGDAAPALLPRDLPQADAHRRLLRPAGAGLRTYGEPIVHQTSGQGKAGDEGYDAFVPLIDSGIYVCVWSARRFASVILYTSGEFDTADATEATRAFFELAEWETALF